MTSWRRFLQYIYRNIDANVIIISIPDTKFWLKILKKMNFRLSHAKLKKRQSFN